MARRFEVQKLETLSGVRIADTVRVRDERWVVRDIQPFAACDIVTLSGADERNQGTRRRVIAPFDAIERVAAPTRARSAGPRRWQRACRRALAAAGPVCRLQAAVAAGIDLLPHQLEPALALIRGDASRLLIADAVGLGKTIQAGLAIAELIERRAAQRVLVLCPAGLRDQWCAELLTRFGLSMWSGDAQALARVRIELPPNVSPWSLEPLIVASIDYVKRAEVLPAVLQERWDVIVVDEAHHAASQSERRRAVEALCGRAPHVVLLTATPHNGDADSFAALCGIGDLDDPLLVFRRTRADVGLRRVRRIHRLHVRPSADERMMHARLAQFAQALGREHAPPAVALGLATLRKRALSSPFALEQTVRRRLSGLEFAEVATSEHQLPLPLDDEGIEGADAAPAWTLPMLADRDRERRLLESLAAAARLAQAHESKLLALARLLRRVREPVVIFTEYRDTLLHVRRRIAPDAAIVHGGLSVEERRSALDRFVGPSGSRGAASILLATDAAGEGLNLHTRCRVVINLELPWSPVRLEQRLGRVDRIGQRRAVHAFHFIARATDEQRVLSRLRDRVANVDADIGADDPLSALPPRRGAHPGLTRLIDEAEAERRRIDMARRLVARGADPAPIHPEHSSGPLVARARGRVRIHLRGRTLVVLRSDLVDPLSRIAASHLTAVSLRRAALAANGGRIDQALLDRIVSHVHDDTMVAWRDASLTDHERYWNRRLAREARIGSASTDTNDLQQPGLFDRRADRAASAAHEAQEAFEAERARRIERLAVHVSLVLQPLRPFVVLTS